MRDGEPPRGYFLVLFEPEGVAAPPADALHLTSPADAPITHLEDELTRVRSQLRATIEQYESQVEEAKASNEELQALNEELRSSAEELETSKEELQSVNEELTTVNQELKIKIDELGSTNNDFQNFINATDIGAIFLDRSRRIKLFTRARATCSTCCRPTSAANCRTSPAASTTTTLHDDVNGVLERLQTFEARGRHARRPRLPDAASCRTAPATTASTASVLSFVDITSRRDVERH